ncbi:hypothetical protein [Pseudomonas sp. DSP3-2-2]|uniref:hypothetical protein n=1 Tax=unclassified Pseudomonas TaxID=196821 RepID=UPI003CF13AB1
MMRKLWKRYVHQLDLDLNTKIIDNVKNLLVCALLFAAGTNVLRSQHEVFMGLAGATIFGWVLIGFFGRSEVRVRIREQGSRLTGAIRSSRGTGFIRESVGADAYICGVWR